MTYFCSIGSQIRYIFETHGIGQTPSSLERYLVVHTVDNVSADSIEYVGSAWWRLMENRRSSFTNLTPARMFIVLGSVDIHIHF